MKLIKIEGKVPFRDATILKTIQKRNLNTINNIFRSYVHN